MKQTLVQKILARASGKQFVSVGEIVEPKVDLAMSHENAALVMNQFQEIYSGTGLEPKVWDAKRIAIIFDHRVPAESKKTATNQKKIRNFVQAQGIEKFHDIRGTKWEFATKYCQNTDMSVRATLSLEQTATQHHTALWEHSHLV